MNRDSRLSVALHVLLHMHEMDGPITSESLGAMMDVNPVVIRRTLGGLRDAGIVAADKGHGGGWSLATDLAKVTLADVYESLDVSSVFGIGLREEAPRCPLEREVNRAVGDALARAEAHLMERFRSVNVADLLKTASKEKKIMHDVIIVGGSYAGLAAAMQLGRARRDVVVIDGGKRRNETVEHAHGLLGFDGEAPAAIAARGREQVRKYPTIQFVDGVVTEARREDEGFVVRTKDAVFASRKLILATGVRDELPEIPGLRERWGKTAFSCPYCDGYERNLGKLGGVLASAEIAAHYATIVSQWGSETTLFSDVPDAPPGIRVERDPIAEVRDAPAGIEVVTRSGKRCELAGLFVGTHVRLPGDFAHTLGCELETFPNGSYYKTDPRTKETTVPGVFAAGDATSPMHALSFAIADGARAGIGAHASLVMGATNKH